MPSAISCATAGSSNAGSAGAMTSSKIRALGRLIDEWRGAPEALRSIAELSAKLVASDEPFLGLPLPDTLVRGRLPPGIASAWVFVLRASHRNPEILGLTASARAFRDVRPALRRLHLDLHQPLGSDGVERDDDEAIAPGGEGVRGAGGE